MSSNEEMTTNQYQQPQSSHLPDQVRSTYAGYQEHHSQEENVVAEQKESAKSDSSAKNKKKNKRRIHHPDQSKITPPLYFFAKESGLLYKGPNCLTKESGLQRSPDSFPLLCKQLYTLYKGVQNALQRSLDSFTKESGLLYKGVWTPFYFFTNECTILAKESRILYKGVCTSLQRSLYSFTKESGLLYKNSPDSFLLL
jgi:hypothetical protein